MKRMKPYTKLARYSGNAALFKMVEMSILATLRGETLHIHAEGLRGTGKTTIMRSARYILPPIQRIKGCLYNCDPANPHCPQHRGLSPDEVAAIGVEMVPMPFLEISHSAKIGTVAGSIDLAKITDPTHPQAAILPGIIPQAHRGIIFIDEINRLADTSPEITDVLLDVMGTKPGRVQIEETGLPLVEIPVQVSVWAASNPDEEPGPLQDIRRQLADRFDLVVDMGRPNSVETIAAILAQNVGNQYENLEPEDWEELARVSHEMETMARASQQVMIPAYLHRLIAKVYVDFGLESIRAVEAIQHAAILHCALRKQKEVTLADVVAVTPLALRHRVDMEVLTEIMKYLEHQLTGGEGEPGSQGGNLPPKGAGKMTEGKRGQEERIAKPVATGFMHFFAAPREGMVFEDNPGEENLVDAPPQRARQLRQMSWPEILRGANGLMPQEG